MLRLHSSQVWESLCNQQAKHLAPHLAPLTCSLIAHCLICRFQVLRLLWRTQDFPRVPAKASQCRSAPWRLHSHSHLWWKPERRDPLARWPHPPSCLRGPTAAWCWFRALLELLVRHTYMYNPKNFWMQILFSTYIHLNAVKTTEGGDWHFGSEIL